MNEPQSFTYDDLCDPDFRPSKNDAAQIYKELVQTHIGTMPGDSHLVSPDLLELVLDVSMCVRHFEGGFELSGTETQKSCQTAFRQYLEHACICYAINQTHKQFEMYPVAGMVVYYWHEEGGAPVFLGTGSLITVPKQQIMPVVWSESISVLWSHVAEKCNKAQDQFRDEIPLAPNEQDNEPLRFDTLLHDLILKHQYMGLAKHLNPTRLAIHPMHRGLCGTPRFEAHGTFTAMMQSSWSNHEAVHKMYELFANPRINAYKIRNGDE